jgi:hypothetical protein
MQFIAKEFYLNKGIKTFEYCRNPTKEDIKIGHGAIHFWDFDIDDCYTNEGILQLKFKAKDDGLLYFACGYEGYVTRSNKIKLELKDKYMPEW